MGKKAKINKWEPIKLKGFGTGKETINKTKRWPEEWEKIFPSNTTNMGLISIQTAHTAQYQKINKPIKTWAEDLNRTFSEEDT